MVESIRVSASGHRHDPVCEFRLSMEHGQAERHERFTCGRDKPLREVFVTSQPYQNAAPDLAHRGPDRLARLARQPVSFLGFAYGFVDLTDVDAGPRPHDKQMG